MTPNQTYTLALMHAIADLLRSGWPLAVVVLALMFWRPLARLIRRLAEFSGFGMQVKFLHDEPIAQAMKALTTPPPADADPRDVAAKTDPKMAQVLLKVDNKPISIDGLLLTLADVYRLPRATTTFVTASDLLTAAATMVTSMGSAKVQGNQVTITLKPDVRPALEERAKENK